MAPLLGPPEIHHPSAAAATTTATGDPFMDVMTAQFNATLSNLRAPARGYTKNDSPTFVSTGNPCLDFFYHILPDTPPHTLHQKLQSAWDHDPLTALKLVCHLRAVRGAGKAALWLHAHHPRTLTLNINHISSFGYLKDMPELLFRLHAGNDVRRLAREERVARLRRKKQLRTRRKWELKSLHSKSVVQKILSWDPNDSGHVSPEMARELRKKRATDMARRAVARYTRDSDYRFLHDKIADCFAQLLLSDLRSLDSGDTRKVGMAAKWCPSLDSSYDKYTLLCENIARRVFPRESYTEYAGLEEAHYAYRIRDRLRKEVLAPLRRALSLPELYMSSKQWDSLPYRRVSSVAMKNYKRRFLKHDKKRFRAFLGQKAKQGSGSEKTKEVSCRRSGKVAAGALLPHEILAEAESAVADRQWSRMVSDLAGNHGKLKNCLAVCDVSGGMRGTALEACLAMGMLVSDLSEEPWKGKVITFSENPQMHHIKGNTLKEKIDFMKRMEWGKGTNFQKVFDQILAIATKAKLGEEKMIKRVVVLSSMEFDKAGANPWETDYEVISRKYRERGYSGPPEMVFWNLKESQSTPVTSEEKGVAMVSGHSNNLLRLLMGGEEGKALAPMEVMEAAIGGPEYQQLVIFD